MNNATYTHKEALAFTPRTSNSLWAQSTVLALPCKEKRSNLKPFLNKHTLYAGIKDFLELCFMLACLAAFWLAIVL